jgi:hypothetical protein
MKDFYHESESKECRFCKFFSVSDINNTHEYHNMSNIAGEKHSSLFHPILVKKERSLYH